MTNPNQAFQDALAKDNAGKHGDLSGDEIEALIGEIDEQLSAPDVGEDRDAFDNLKAARRELRRLKEQAKGGIKLETHREENTR